MDILDLSIQIQQLQKNTHFGLSDVYHQKVN